MIKEWRDNESIVIVGDNGTFKTTVDETMFLNNFYKKVHDKIEEMERLADIENVGVSIQDITETAIQLTFEEWLHITIDDRWVVALYKCLRSTDTNIMDEQVWQLVKLMLECRKKEVKLGIT